MVIRQHRYEPEYIRNRVPRAQLYSQRLLFPLIHYISLSGPQGAIHRVRTTSNRVSAATPNLDFLAALGTEPRIGSEEKMIRAREAVDLQPHWTRGEHVAGVGTRVVADDQRKAFVIMRDAVERGRGGTRGERARWRSWSGLPLFDFSERKGDWNVSERKQQKGSDNFTHSRPSTVAERCHQSW